MNSMNNMVILFSALLISHVLYAGENLFDESLEDILKTKSELKADIGSREEAKNFLDSRAPVDVITYEQIENSGATSIVEALRYFVAGFNAPSTTVTDGSDHVATYSLRGMNPDQILVLINGKRVHTSALVHVNATIGHGSNHVDLDTIALKSIERIEILRDGAAAQYGSDAISGVINIILKGLGDKNSISVHTGQRKKGDGTKLYADTFISVPLKNDGFVNATISAEKQDQTQRAGADKRMTPPEVHTHAGIPESQNYKGVFNAELLEIDDTIIYSNAFFNYRDSQASAFYRTPDITRPLYADGFLPRIDAKILDYSFVVGAKGEVADIEWDLSNVYGANEINLYVDNTMNYSLGAASPTAFHNGTLSFIQNTINLDLKKKISQMELSGGVEYRYEDYEIKAGDFNSYTGTAAQGLAGYRADNEVDSNRESYALYLDGIYNVTKAFSLETALRYENYSDFGSTTNAKVALGYKIIPELLLRTSGSTGYRAPSLAQSNYSHTSSFTDSKNFLSTQGIFRVDDAISQSLGAKELKPEKSKHFTIGSVYQPTKTISFMVDYFYTEVEDKIMLSNTMAPSTAAQQAIFNANNVSGARFFTNAVDTKTQGIDAKFNYTYLFEESSVLDFGIWYSYNKNSITAFNDEKITRQNSYKEIDKIENGQPQDALRVLTNYAIERLNIAMNLSRYGSYEQVVGAQSYSFEPDWTTDLDVAYKVNKSVTIALGGTNIFDVMPNKWDGLSGVGYGYDAILPYSNYSPFGYSGAYYYARATIKF